MNNLMRIVLIVSIWLGGALAVPAETNAIKSLTIRECIDRALAANLDIKFERLNPRIADWGIVEAQSVFDPQLNAGLDFNGNRPPATSTNGSFETRKLALNASIGGKLPTGTGYTLSGDGSRTEPTFLPYGGGPALSLSQPLLKDFGTGPNLAQIRVARQSRGIAGQNFHQRVINTISAVNNSYYELVYAIENHKSLLEDLDRAKALLDQNRQRVRIGVLSPLDVTQAEAGVAEREEAVIVADRVIRDNENALKRLITQDVLEFRDQSLLPVDYPQFEAVDLDLSEHIRRALENRPDFLAARQELERRNILVGFNRNQLLPQVDVQGSYALNGAGSTAGRVADQVGSADFPAWGIGLTFSFPLGNRSARANYNIARLQSDQQVIALKSLEQDIIVAVDNAVRLVQSNLKRIDATKAAARLADESLKAEETRLRAGTSTSFLVLQAQAQLAAAQSAEIRARADYAESLVALAQTEGTTLQRHGIQLQD